MLLLQELSNMCCHICFVAQLSTAPVDISALVISHSPMTAQYPLYGYCRQLRCLSIDLQSRYMIHDSVGVLSRDASS